MEGLVGQGEKVWGSRAAKRVKGDWDRTKLTRVRGAPRQQLTELLKVSQRCGFQGGQARFFHLFSLFIFPLLGLGFRVRV